MNSENANNSPVAGSRPDELRESEFIEGATVAIHTRPVAAPQFASVEAPRVTQLEPGDRIGPYEVREHIGDGGMASVFKAWHTGLHRYEALKVPRHQHTYGPEASFLRRLLTEARTSARLHHPHIVGIHNVSEPDAPLQYFAMDYVRGCDLAKLLESRGRLPIDEALPILAQIASALDYAHSQDVIHRDIKPGNILLQKSVVLSGASTTENDEVSQTESASEATQARTETDFFPDAPAKTPDEDWLAKVVDFGISRAGEDTGGTRLTRSGMIVGTPEYMSPEQSGSGEPVTYRTDIYSLAIVAYEMLCGAPPFTAGDGVSRISILMKHVNDEPESPARKLEGLPEVAGEAILKALAKKPEERFDSCSDFVSALAGALADANIGAYAGSGVATRAKTVYGRAGSQKTAMFSPLSRGDTNLMQLPVDAEFASGKAILRSRNSTLLAGLGGLMVGAALVFGWFGLGGERTHTGPPVASTALVKDVAALTSVAPTALPGAPAATIPVLNTKRLRRTASIPFARRVQNSAALTFGQKRITRTGRNGQREIEEAVTFRGTKEIERRALSDKVILKPLDQLELVGTKKPIAKALPKKMVAVKATPRKTATRKIVVRKAPIRKPVLRRTVSDESRPRTTRRARRSYPTTRATARPVTRQRRRTVKAVRKTYVQRRTSTRTFGSEAPLPP